jgi:hypothetical protein
MGNKKTTPTEIRNALTALCLLSGAIAFPVQAGAEVIYRMNFESGIDLWSIDNGVWQVGTPTAGPSKCFQGKRCAGTVLSGNYPVYTDSRLVSRSIGLPRVIGAGEIQLRFYHWFSYAAEDAGYVQVSTFDPTTRKWSGWTTISEAVVDISQVWSVRSVDLTPYTNSRVRIAFQHTAHCFFSCPGVSTGWYVDEVTVETNPPAACELSADAGRPSRPGDQQRMR